jgi:hypothetical protein
VIVNEPDLEGRADLVRKAGAIAPGLSRQFSQFGELGRAVAHGLNFRLEPPVESATSAPDRPLEVEA